MVPEYDSCWELMLICRFSNYSNQNSSKACTQLEAIAAFNNDAFPVFLGYKGKKLLALFKRILVNCRTLNCSLAFCQFV